MKANEADIKPAFSRVILKMIGLTFGASPGAFVLFLLTSLIFTALLIADLHLIRVLLDDLPLLVEGKIAYRAVLLTVLLLGGVNIIDTLMNAAMNMLYEYLAKRTVGNMTRAMGEKAARLDLIRFESAELYDGIEKAVNGRLRGFEAMEAFVFSLIFHGGYFFFLALYLIRIEPVLVLGIFLAFLPVAISRYIRASAFYNTENRVAPLRREFRHYEDCLCHREFFKETRSCGAVPFFRRLYDRTLAAYNLEMWRTELRTGMIDLGLKVLTLMGYGGLLLLLVYFTLDVRISPALFGAVYFAMDSIFKWFEELFNRLGAAFENAAFGGNYLAFMDLPERKTGRRKIPRDRGITLENVSFRYPGTREKALDGVCLTISPGDSVAIVGENGAGKSTLVKILAGMLTPDQGRVTAGGVDLRDADNSSAYEGLSGVFQRYQCYRMTLGENVSISRPDIEGWDKEMVKTAVNAALAGADFRVDSKRFPGGPDTVLSREFGGTDLSGGEWQRVALARGLFRPHETIILDEPTAAIDPIEETHIYRRFIQAAAGKTAIIVTHRLGSARIAGRIIVMAGGRIVETGTHEQLMKSEGTYARMFASQAKWYIRDR